MNTLHPTATPSSHAPTSGIGTLIREWRQQRRLSQMDLALDVGISTRHLSYVETGRARPGVEVLLALAERLALPLRTRNVWLLAAGYAPRYTEQPLASDQMAQIHAALDKLLHAHDPYPGVVLDGGWNVVRANSAAQRLIALLPPALREPGVNMFRASLHPEGYAAHTRNLHEWGGYLLRTLRRQVQESRDPQLRALEQEVLAYPQVAALLETPGPASGAPELLIPCEMEIGGHRLSLFTTMTAFGTPRDITLAELSIELFYPSDPATDALLHQFAAAD
ncbi:XRE family transcriptional regulator [Hylemonella gracilis str. Niagara R]|uniref:XRE family transcriptional regulator n=1 Tax=Hylemonella gracilis str. Niagara R TaxID=1458275 RepID=A0A016XEG4_9BURK|nr:helix-turn-helix transcriptional regulator [Hylemonella gracilis]EYC50310.1 XRE family transcriptional regulator [Hylemonella gracilis str. Niagara R]